VHRHFSDSSRNLTAPAGFRRPYVAGLEGAEFGTTAAGWFAAEAWALDLNSTMPFCFAFTNCRVLPLSAQNSDAPSNAAFLTPRPFLSQHISDNEMR